MTPSKDIARLLEIMEALRTPETGCPWDLEQDFKSIAPYTIEEAYEVADAVDRDDMEDLRLELGDLLLQSVYHAQMAKEKGHFDFGDVVHGITQKMIRRHPHVFGTADRKAYSATQMSKTMWEAIKAEEKAETNARRIALGLPPKEKSESLLDKVSTALPAIIQAEKLQKTMSTVGFDWEDPLPALEKVDEEVQEIREVLDGDDREALSLEIGDLLFAAINLARLCNIDPESALRQTNKKVRKRFAYIEQILKQEQIALEDATLSEMEDLWVKAKVSS